MKWTTAVFAAVVLTAGLDPAAAESLIEVVAASAPIYQVPGGDVVVEVPRGALLRSAPDGDEGTYLAAYLDSGEWRYVSKKAVRSARLDQAPRPSDSGTVTKVCDALVAAQDRAQVEADARYEINAFSPNYRPENVFKNIDEARLLSDRYVTIALRKFGLSPAAGDGELKLICVERLRAR